ncbi:hypothetical protein D1872_205880 [compost metagenome]
MSRNYDFIMNGHPNIYNNYSPRNLKIYFSEPDVINDDTGILLLIPGFGGNANSNVYKKMRSTFADKFNLITVQCDYFGWGFMQAERLQESVSNFNDMGIMQALDNITAVTVLAEIIKDNGLTFNAGKIIAYGQSHGAYIAYLCNIFAPSLFSLIIDNSAWIFPLYLLGDRQITINGSLTDFSYLAKQLIIDAQILHLPSVSKKVNNQCTIHSFHGADDKIITIEDKRDFCLSLNNCVLHEITRENMDQRIFKSSSHSLDADLLLLFEYVLNDLNVEFTFNDRISINNNKIETNNYAYEFDYTFQVPLLNIQSRV